VRAALLAFLGAAVLAAGCEQGGIDQATQAPALAGPFGARPKPQNFGPYAVGVRTETFIDTSRPTAANNGAPAQPSRTLQTLVLYPAEGAPGDRDVPDAPPAREAGPFPLIEFSHGFTANGPTYALLLRRFAAAGYVVAAPTFPLTSRGAPGGPSGADYANQPADVSFVISEMLRLNGDRASVLHDLIDSREVAVSGHSMGAMTTYGVAYNSCCIDKRIKAAVPISGIEAPFGDGTFLGRADVPLLAIHGDADATLPFKGSLDAYRTASAPKFLLRIERGPHTPFFGTGGEVIVKVMRDFFDHFLKDRTGSLDAILADGNVAGATELSSVLS
jgi:fermentation-respiration switch protein FrsA (DUF1100 family)